ncbi:MAG TPA: chromate efflux transporter [Trebonia sp.]
MAVSPPAESPQPAAEVPLRTVLREWGRIGCIGFGGPPAHIRLLRQLCVERKGWMDARTFEDAIAVCNLLPGPASTQLAIFCAWRLRGRLGALIGGAAFIVPGLAAILALSVLFLAGSPPLWVLGAGAGAGAAVPAVAVNAGASLVGPSWRNRRSAARWLLYLAAGLAVAATAGEWLVLVLLGCGAVELAFRSSGPDGAAGKLRSVIGAPAVLAARAPALLAAGAAVTAGTLASVAWEAFKVGALSFGGGFVIIPLMQTDAVSHYHWMTGGQFLNAVALGQITPGPVVQTVAVIGYAAAGIGAGLLAAAVAFAPSFAFVLFGGPRFEQIRGNARARAFLGGAGPAAIGAILGSAITLGRVLSHPWQYAVLTCALVLLIPLRRGVVLTLLSAAAVGVLIALAAGTVSP